MHKGLRNVMDYGKTAVLVSFALVSACVDGPDSEAQGGDQAPVVSAEIRSWLETTDGDGLSTEASAREDQVAPVSEMIDGLVARLEAQPNDLKGWRLLAQSYAYVGQMEHARAAAAKAVDLGADADELDALVANGNRLGR